MQKILFILLFIFLSHNLLQAQRSQQVIFILDASGSMWGQIEGRDKITIAKEAIVNNLSTWKEDVKIGLVAFGHNNLKRCMGSETIIPLTVMGESNMLNRLKDVNPKTEGSIAHALNRAAKAMHSDVKKATIVLISDGQKACSMDPCKTAETLADEALDFRIHVIGFNVASDSKAKLKCIASVSDGKYYAVANADELNDALANVVEKIKYEKTKPKSRNLRLTASEREGSNQIEASHRIYSIIHGELQKDTLVECTSKQGKACIKHLNPGRYQIQTYYKGVVKESRLLVENDRTINLHVSLNETGKVEIIAKDKEHGKWLKAKHILYKILNGKVQKKSTASCTSDSTESCLGRIETGQYLLITKASTLTKQSRINVVKDKLNRVNVYMGEMGSIKITAYSSDRNAKVLHTIYKEGVLKSIASCWSENRNSCELLLPSGEYNVVSTYNGHEKKSHFQLKDTESSHLRVRFSSTDN
jgi:Mg-chelatase subunit ChlD